MENNQDFEQKNQPEEPDKSKEQFKEIHHYYKERGGMFTPGRLFLGLLIIFIGLIFLAQNAGWIKVSFFFSWSLVWPIIIILIGLSLISFRGWLGAILGLIITLLIAGLVLVIIFGQISFDDREINYQETIFMEKEEAVDSASLDIKTGAGELIIKGGSPVLLAGQFSSNFLELAQESQVKENIQEINLKTKGKWLDRIGRKWNELNLQIGSTTPVNIFTDTGAADIDFDLSEIIAQEIDIDTGASSLEMILGDKADQAKVNIDAGASSLDIKLPRTVGAELFIDAGLTSKNLIDFKQIDSHHYQSTNFETATKTITLDLNLGVSSLNIGWR